MGPSSEQLDKDDGERDATYGKARLEMGDFISLQYSFTGRHGMAFVRAPVPMRRRDLVRSRQEDQPGKLRRQVDRHFDHPANNEARGKFN